MIRETPNRVKTDPKSVDEYIAAQPPPMQRILRQARSAIRKGAPGAEEVISYKMPTYNLHGRRILHFAGWTQHFALYGATGPVLAEFQDDLASYEIKKGTIRFPTSGPIPVQLIERIARFRAREVARHENPDLPKNL